MTICPPESFGAIQCPPKWKICSEKWVGTHEKIVLWLRNFGHGLSSLIDISDEDEEYDLLVTGKVGACAAEAYDFLSAITQNMNAKGLPVKFDLKKW